MYNEEFFGILAIAGGILSIFITLIVLAYIILYVIGRWNLFKKAGKNGWEAIVPFYNDWVYVEIAGLNWWWFLIIISTNIISILSIEGLGGLGTLASYFGLFVCNYNIAKRLNKSTGMAILMTLFPGIVIPIVGLNKKYTYNMDIPVSKNGIFGQKEETTNNTQTNNNQNTQPNNNTANNTTNTKFCSNCGNQLTDNEKFCANCGKEV